MRFFKQKNYNYAITKIKRIERSELLWRRESPDGGQLSDDEFLNTYSVVISNTLSDLNMSAYVERYGGAGVGFHGGSGRTITYENVTIKGCGATLLCSDRAPLNHKHGTLSLIEGISEVINSLLVDQVTPCGSVRSLALIGLKDGSSFYKDERVSQDCLPCRGSLLIRDLCIRPASFLEATYWKEADGTKDSDRVNRFYAELRDEITDSKELLKEVGQCLDRIAEQFAFARISGLAHGAVTPSNISVDGKWLDLGNVSFLPSNVNCLVSEDPMPPFYEENGAAKQSIVEILDNYCAFINKSCDTEALRKIFERMFFGYMHKHSIWRLGLNLDDYSLVKELTSYNYLAEKIVSQVKHNGFVIRERPFSLPPTDSAIDLARAIGGNETFNEPWGDISTGVSSLVRDIKTIRPIESSAESLRLAMAIVSLKRATLPEYFYKNRLMSDIYKLGLQGGYPEIRNFIRAIEGALCWFFEGITNGLVCIIRSERNSLIYNLKDAIFQYVSTEGSIEVNVDAIESYIRSIQEEISDLSFSFDRYSKELYELITLNGSKKECIR